MWRCRSLSFGEHLLLIYFGTFPISLGPALVLVRKTQAVPVEAAVLTEGDGQRDDGLSSLLGSAVMARYSG